MLDAGTFRFLNVTGELHSSGGWNDPRRDKLWLYNLHYFDDLNAEGASDRRWWHRTLLARWVRENPPGHGNGWEAYPLSLRIVNWIKWALAGNALEPSWNHSLSAQTRWLGRRLEWHLLGNHLFANAKALVFAGCYFEGMEAGGWLQQGLTILARELPEQILRDGGHFERSPMYHAVILADVMDLIRLASLYPDVIPRSSIDVWRAAGERMLGWITAMTHPDGGIAFFNDAAFGIAPDTAALLMRAAALGLALPAAGRRSCVHLESSGYARLAMGEAVVIADIGEIGPDYLPGHAHADTLSFELSLRAQRVIVNSGTSLYRPGAERLRQRGTAAHNTVEVDGENSSEVWSAFRVARRARPRSIRLEPHGESIALAGAHDGYRRLSGRPLHRRTWQLNRSSLRITDTVEGGFRRAVARYHLHPGIVAQGGGRRGQLKLPDGRNVAWTVIGGSVQQFDSTWHPEFGRSVPNQRLDLVLEGSESSITFAWN